MELNASGLRQGMDLKGATLPMASPVSSGQSHAHTAKICQSSAREADLQVDVISAEAMVTCGPIRRRHEQDVTFLIQAPM